MEVRRVFDPQRFIRFDDINSNFDKCARNSPTITLITAAFCPLNTPVKLNLGVFRCDYYIRPFPFVRKWTNQIKSAITELAEFNSVCSFS